MTTIRWKLHYWKAIIRKIFSNHKFSLIVFHLVYCCIAHIWCLFDIWSLTLLVFSQRRLLGYFLSPIEVGSFTSLGQSVIFLHSAPIASDEMFEYVLRWLGHIVRRCVAVPVHEVSKTIAVINTMHYAVDIVFSKSFSELVCLSLYLPLSTLWNQSCTGSVDVYSTHCSAFSPMAPV